jgi:hypothetical protein
MREEGSDELSLSNDAYVDAVTFHDPTVESQDLTHYCFACLPMDQFSNWCIHGSVAKAVSWLVHQALVQEPIRFDATASAQIPPHAIQLFLHIAKLLMTTGQIQHNVLSVILDLLMGLLTPQQQDWPTTPRTMAGFQLHILNPTNKHALIAQLPIPQSYMLADNSHSFCCLHKIAAFSLLLPPSVCLDPVPLRLQELCRSVKIREFLAEPIDPSTPCLVSLGLIFWLDGWDPSASSKNNRSPVHTASATLLFIDNNTGLPFDAPMFPIACGPGKANHNVVFEALRKSIKALGGSKKLVWSHHHQRWTFLHCLLIAFLMDQPKRRGSTCLLGGNSKRHAMSVLSCIFEQLEHPFLACPTCMEVTNQYVTTGDFSLRIVYHCARCYSFSLFRLVHEGRYKPDSGEVPFDDQTPGAVLGVQPGTLTFELLM